MGLDFSQKIQKVREAVNIVDIVGQYLKLNRKGSNFWAVCPFHQDSNPSLSVSQEKQIYKCFSCGEQGNVFVFLQRYKNIDFYSALKEVASFAKIDLKELDLDVQESKVEKVHPFKVLNNLALSFYQYQLTTEEGKQALEYLKQRNISEANINDFLLGYAPSNNQLLDYLVLQGYNKMDLVDAGVAKITDQDEVKDMFFNRIIFPIVDLDGNCLGFSARKYLSQGIDNFKYINTPETEIFKKGNILYNLYNAKNAISVNNNSLYLVEGYMDVISLSSQNIKNCVALMGTNLTKDHMHLLSKITNNIVIFLDGDEAGKIATIKIATNLLANKFSVKIINNTTLLDPDELIKSNPSEFNKVINDALHPLDFTINFLATKYNLEKDSEQVKKFLLDLKPLWNAEHDVVAIKFYLEKLKEKTKLEEAQLLQILKQENSSSQKQIDPKPNQSKLKQISLKEKLLEVQKQLFFFLLLDRNVYLFLEKEKFIFYNKELMNLYFLVTQKYQEDEKITKINFEEILALVKDNEIFGFLQGLINQYQNRNYQINQSILEDYLKIIKKYLIEIEVESLNQQIAAASDFENKIELLQRMSILKNKSNE